MPYKQIYVYKGTLWLGAHPSFCKFAWSGFQTFFYIQKAAAALSEAGVGKSWVFPPEHSCTSGILLPPAIVIF